MSWDLWNHLAVPQHNRHLHLEFDPQGHLTAALAYNPFTSTRRPVVVRGHPFPGALALLRD